MTVFYLEIFPHYGSLGVKVPTFIVKWLIFWEFGNSCIMSTGGSEDSSSSGRSSSTSERTSGITVTSPDNPLRLLNSQSPNQQFLQFYRRQTPQEDLLSTLQGIGKKTTSSDSESFWILCKKRGRLKKELIFFIWEKINIIRFQLFQLFILERDLHLLQWWLMVTA